MDRSDMTAERLPQVREVKRWDDVPEERRARYDGRIRGPVNRCNGAIPAHDGEGRFLQCNKPRRPDAEFCWAHGGPRVMPPRPDFGRSLLRDVRYASAIRLTTREREMLYLARWLEQHGHIFTEPAP